MSIASYPRTIQNGQLANNGNENAGTGLMLWDATQNKYIAATPSTFGSGGTGNATASNQDLQIVEAQGTNSLLGSTNGLLFALQSLFSNGTNTSILNDSFVVAVVDNNFPYGFAAFPCKYVTLINNTLEKIQYSLDESTYLTLPSNKEVRINTTNAANIFLTTGAVTPLNIDAIITF